MHLPYEPGPSAGRSKSPVNTARTFGEKTRRVEKETMTEISLMWNPFKSELKDVKVAVP